MYEKFYDFIIPSFDNVELSTTETDSFLFSAAIPEGETVKSLLKKHEDHFDFSNLSKNGEQVMDKKIISVFPPKKYEIFIESNLKSISRFFFPDSS